MDKNKLLSDIRFKGSSVRGFIKKLNKLGSKMNAITFYRKINGDSEFRQSEIINIAKALNLSDQDILDIFFNKKVS